MLEILTGFIIHLIASIGYPGIFVLMVLNVAAIPFPSEITLPFSGFLASSGSLNLWLVIITGVLGDFVGSIVGFAIGYFLEEALLLNLVKKFGKFILLTAEDFEKATRWIKKYGSLFVFIGKMTPGIKSFVSVAAGISELNFKKFLVANILAGIIYVSLVTYIGFYLGSRWNSIGIYFRRFELAIIVLLAVGVIFYINYKLKIIKFKR